MGVNLKQIATLTLSTVSGTEKCPLWGKVQKIDLNRMHFLTQFTSSVYPQDSNTFTDSLFTVELVMFKIHSALNYLLQYKKRA